MSYCVNCGVKLDASLSKCPLCQTPIINPNTLKQIQSFYQSPYPEHKGIIEPVNRKDMTIFLTVTLSSIAICCGLLNFLFFEKIMWSIPVIGLCLVIWIFILPLTLFQNLNAYSIALLDCFAIASYIYMLTFLTTIDVWYYKVAFPLVTILFLIWESLVFLVKHFPYNFFVGFLYFTITTAIICISVELLLDNIFQTGFSLSWSAIVLTVCTIISVILITILSLRRIRHMLQKRFHI